jgi:hypothetical protein
MSEHDQNTRIAIIESNQCGQERLLREVHAAVVGPVDGSRLGLGAQLTAQDIRIIRLERIVLWGGTLYTGVLSIVIGAWALRVMGPPTSNSPSVIYLQPTPTPIHQMRQYP